MPPKIKYSVEEKGRWAPLEKEAFLDDLLAPEIPIATERLKRELKAKHEIQWVDLLVLCALVDIQKTNYFIQTSDIIQYLGMNRGWIYDSVKRLRDKRYLEVTSTGVGQTDLINISGEGNLFLNTVSRDYRYILR